MNNFPNNHSIRPCVVSKFPGGVSRKVTNGDRVVELNGEAKDGAAFVKGIEVAPPSSWMELTVLKYTK